MTARENSAPLAMTEQDAARHVATLAAPNPRIGRPDPADWSVWVGKRDATAALQSAGFSDAAIRKMVGTHSEARVEERRRLRKAGA